jgi:hypothetical protein
MGALERLKAQARASLQAAASRDAQLARTTQGGQAWERGEKASQRFIYIWYLFFNCIAFLFFLFNRRTSLDI